MTDHYIDGMGVHHVSIDGESVTHDITHTPVGDEIVGGPIVGGETVGDTTMPHYCDGGLPALGAIAPGYPGLGLARRNAVAPTEEQIKAWEEQQAKRHAEHEARLAHDARVHRWRQYVAVVITAQAVSGVDTKVAVKIADELCAAEDERFSNTKPLTLLKGGGA